MENNKSVSSVEWLVNQLIKEGKLFYDDYKCIEQAKEMEKQQIIDAYSESAISFMDGILNKDDCKEEAENYYKDTFSN